MKLINPYISPFEKPLGNLLGGGNISQYDNKLVFYNFAQTNATESIIEEVGRASSLSTTRASNSTATLTDGSTQTYGSNTAALAPDRGALIQGAATNKILQSSNLDTTWSIRGTATATVTTEAAPVAGTFYTECLVNEISVSDLIQPLSAAFTVSTTLSVQFYMKTVTSSGELRVSSQKGNAFGLWDIDLSLVADDDLITKDHAAVTEINPFASNTGGGAGLWFYPKVTGDITFKIASVNMVEADYVSSPIETTTVAVTRAADNSTIKGSDFTLNNDFVLTMEMVYHADTSAFPLLLYSFIDAANRLLIYRSTASLKTIYFQNEVLGVSNTINVTLSTAITYGDDLFIKVTKSSTDGATLYVLNRTNSEEGTTNNPAHTEDTPTWETDISVGSANGINGVNGYYKSITVTPL